jgi:hypothetical protein
LFYWLDTYMGYNKVHKICKRLVSSTVLNDFVLVVDFVLGDGGWCLLVALVFCIGLSPAAAWRCRRFRWIPDRVGPKRGSGHHETPKKLNAERIARHHHHLLGSSFCTRLLHDGRKNERKVIIVPQLLRRSKMAEPTTSHGDDDRAVLMQAAVAAMGQEFFDVTIICTTDDHQAEYWMNLLENGLLASSTKEGGTKKKVLAVSEDWGSAGGAGNGLGTLYAWQKACALAATRYDNFDLAQELANGKVSAALYHTAGKGTRMAPLPASENNNKPGVVRFSLPCFSLCPALFRPHRALIFLAHVLSTIMYRC